MRLPQWQWRPKRLFLDPEQRPRVHTPYVCALHAHLEKRELEWGLLYRAEKVELKGPDLGPRE